MKQIFFCCKYVFATIFNFLQQKYFVANNLFSCSASKTESEAFPLGSPSDYSSKGGQSYESRFYQRDEMPRMVGQCGGGSKEGK